MYFLISRNGRSDPVKQGVFEALSVSKIKFEHQRDAPVRAFD